MGTWSWWWKPQNFISTVCFIKIYLKWYQNSKILLFFMDFLKKYFYLKMSKIIVFTCLSQMISLCSPSQKQIHLHGSVWNCSLSPKSAFMDLVVWSRLFLWTWLGCLACFSIFTSVTAVGLIQNWNYHKRAVTWSVVCADKDYTPPARCCMFFICAYKLWVCFCRSGCGHFPG